MSSKKIKVVLTVFCFILLTGCKKTEVDYPIVEVEPVAVDNIEIYGDYVGLIRASRSVEIHARVEGFLERMTFNEGKEVRAGEALFYINNKPYKARVEKAKAQLKRDEAQELKAESDLARIEPLYNQNAASRLDLDNAVAALNMSKADVAMSKADLEQAELELSYTVVRSPLSGYISERYVDIGTLVGNSKSLLATVVKRDTVLVDFKLTSLDYLRSQRRNVHLGEQDSTRSWQPTVVVTLADNTIYNEKGIVDFASPQVDPKTGTFGVRAVLPNPNQVLLPGQFTRVKLLLDVLENAVVVPRKAISIEKGGAFIFVVRPDSIVEKRYIETGPEQNNKIVVTRGLTTDEKIVVEGYQKLAHGQKVIARSEEEEKNIEEQEIANEQKEEAKK
ncbi:membrane fusion protein (multidrug efflux system) [Dysgonomonas hofstadii]|uniref:Membrane fusion protein (Multidrug efflux system) n=1 Tax=Dysgonomonas hofstadii TaxID=637886 RepID=A0A840CHQ7_9BACT|nr:efflux RND transporter periplasmic adaptor subunit [Dysgonomonas hofstadii]MBB4035547.1 membrane fusion protein (multidrug efflux system) [Dysgonomonas hofstadii]